MASGLACGLGYVTFACAFVILMLVVLVVLNLLHFGDDRSGSKQLKLTVPENLNYSHVFDEVFEKYTTQSTLRRVRTTNMGTMYELTYSVSMKRNADEKEFIDHLRMRNGNLNITLGMAEIDAGILN